MPKINLAAIPRKTGSLYPAPYRVEMDGRSTLRLGDAAGLTQFGANLVTLEPGAKSSIQHWHVEQDEFAIVTEGELTLVETDGEATMQPGDCAAFPANKPVGHTLENRSASVASFLVIGTHTPTETAYYTDRDMMVKIDGDDFSFTRKDGTLIGEGDT